MGKAKIVLPECCYCTRLSVGFNVHVYGGPNGLPITRAENEAAAKKFRVRISDTEVHWIYPACRLHLSKPKAVRKVRVTKTRKKVA